MPNVEGAVYVYDVRVVRDVATVLGNSADATLYGSEFTRVQTAYNNAYFDRANNRYTPVSQANIAMPLEFGIVPAGSEAAVAAALVKDIGQPMEPTNSGGFGAVQANHITAGDIGTTFVWRALGDYNQPDLVQTMIMQPSLPSYLSMINGGETTITENWNYPSTRSHDHDMYAGIFEWLYRSLGGISSSKPGYAEISLEARDADGPRKRFGFLQFGARPDHVGLEPRGGYGSVEGERPRQRDGQGVFADVRDRRRRGDGQRERYGDLQEWRRLGKRAGRHVRSRRRRQPAGLRRVRRRFGHVPVRLERAMTRETALSKPLKLASKRWNDIMTSHRLLVHVGALGLIIGACAGDNPGAGGGSGGTVGSGGVAGSPAGWHDGHGWRDRHGWRRRHGRRDGRRVA